MRTEGSGTAARRTISSVCPTLLGGSAPIDLPESRWLA
jgi:hypothetical protein